MKARPLVIFDIDGTVANADHRLHFICFNKSMHGNEEYFKKDWNKFYTACDEDTPIPQTIQVLQLLQMFCDIKFFTGRNEGFRKDTIKWLDQHIQLVNIKLTMRAKDDQRPDYDVKREMYEALSDHDKERLLCVYEDRDQVVKMWRDLGVMCYQVCDGDY